MGTLNVQDLFRQHIKAISNGGRLIEAEILLRAYLNRYNYNFVTELSATIWMDLAQNMFLQFRFEEAEQINNDLIVFHETVKPLELSLFGKIKQQLAASLEGQGRPKEAEPIWRDLDQTRRLVANLNIQGKYSEATESIAPLVRQIEIEGEGNMYSWFQTALYQQSHSKALQNLQSSAGYSFTAPIPADEPTFNLDFNRAISLVRHQTRENDNPKNMDLKLILPIMDKAISQARNWLGIFHPETQYYIAYRAAIIHLADQ